jgi:hypothetical protein
MKRFALAFGIFLVAAAEANGQLREGSCGVYFGTLGESTGIGMSLSVRDKELEGAYFYREYLTDIPLKGSPTGEREITLRVTDSGGAAKGTFHLHLSEHGPHYGSTAVLQGEVLQGTWSSADGSKTYAVALRLQHDCAKPGSREYEVAGAKDDALVEKNAQAFCAAVLHGKPEEAAKYVSYPCTVSRDGKRIFLNSEAEFLKSYDAIFTKAFVARIATGVPHHMFANYQGIMIADGAVWFDAEGKARNFNHLPTP